MRLLMSNVAVLRAGSNSSTGLGGGGSNQQSDVTLDVNNELAGALAFAADNGKVWLVLRPANATASAPSTFSVQSLLVAQPTPSTGGKR
jgi:Flp pilus assembly protein CpaB